MNEIILFGGGGHSYAVLALIESLGVYQPVAIVDDHPKVEKILGVPLLKYTTESFEGKALCISIGANAIRKEKAKLFSKALFPTHVHQSAVVYPSSQIGRGCVLLPNAVIDAECRIGDFCIVNNNATVSHQTLLGDFVHVAIHVAIAGGVVVGEGTLVGAGAIILPEITIGKWAVIGAGAVVTKDVPDYAVVFGNPAKIVRINPNHEI